jgi:ATP-dependent Clp protease ATP-binding subunit ClpB
LTARPSDWLADAGYDPVFGARPLKRVIQRSVQDPLAELLLGGEVLDGATLPVTAGPGGLEIGGRIVPPRDSARPTSAPIH